ncbi:hypothetical protein [Thalassovita sp.]|uniref:hypothetical protein n=1 Tax=Thalassovita sp. TaxID=1979401 RepID=UPI002B2697CE|nr:hypothetical protein [Thalassovita sp.]
MNDGSDKAYRMTVSINNEIYGKNTLAAEIANNNALGNNILKDDLGTYEETNIPRLANDLDWQTRDQLISHTRQDVASTFAHALSAFKAAHEAREIAGKTRRLARWILFLMIILVVQGFLILSALA